MPSMRQSLVSIGDWSRCPGVRGGSRGGFLLTGRLARGGARGNQGWVLAWEDGFRPAEASEMATPAQSWVRARRPVKIAGWDHGTGRGQHPGLTGPVGCRTVSSAQRTMRPDTPCTQKFGRCPALRCDRLQGFLHTPRIPADSARRNATKPLSILRSQSLRTNPFRAVLVCFHEPAPSNNPARRKLHPARCHIARG